MKLAEEETMVAGWLAGWVTPLQDCPQRRPIQLSLFSEARHCLQRRRVIYLLLVSLVFDGCVVADQQL